MRQANRPHDDDGPNALPLPGTGRSVAWNEVPFGPGKATSGTLGTLIDEGIELVSRTLYIQCSTVQDGSSPDTGGVTPIPLYPMAEINWGAHGRRHRQFLDVPPGAEIRVPIVCTDLRVAGRIIKQPTPGMDWNVFNTLPASQEGAPGPGQTFTMSAFAVEGVAGENRGPLIRKIQGLFAGAGNQFFPTAQGAYAVRLIGDPAVLAFRIHQLFASGSTADYGPAGGWPALSLPIEIPSGAQFVEVFATGAAPFEIEYYLAF